MERKTSYFNIQQKEIHPDMESKRVSKDLSYRQRYEPHLNLSTLLKNFQPPPLKTMDGGAYGCELRLLSHLLRVRVQSNQRYAARTTGGGTGYDGYG
jgi:hypothetical protein